MPPITEEYAQKLQNYGDKRAWCFATEPHVLKSLFTQAMLQAQLAMLDEVHKDNLDPRTSLKITELSIQLQAFLKDITRNHD